MQDVLRALSESGATTLAMVVTVCVLVRHLVQAAPVLMREWHVRMLLRRALSGRTKAERDRAHALLRLLIGERLEPPPQDPPGG
jgi:hypothetical protein